MPIEEGTSNPQNPASALGTMVGFFGLERNTLIIALAGFLLGAGEELWKKFLPKYLESLGASIGVVGLFGTTKDLLDAVYQYPGGWISDRTGSRRAFLIFVGLAFFGYLIYLASPSWEMVFVGLVFVTAWQSMASPAIFAAIGNALPKGNRAVGFTLQAVLKRIPMIVSPVLGGILIASYGVQNGLRIGLLITLVLSVSTFAIVKTIDLPIVVGEVVNIRGVWLTFHGDLKRLLVSDIIIRMCEGMAEIFVVLYVSNILGFNLKQYGWLIAVQMLTSILVYFPALRIADRFGRKPFVIATFLCFALFPIAVVLSTGIVTLIAAFVIGGLREIGEPSRKAMIVDLAESHVRGRTVGLYYLIRSFSVAPAALVGGFLWQFSPSVPFFTATVIGLIGTVIFALTVDEQFAN